MCLLYQISSHNPKPFLASAMAVYDEAVDPEEPQLFGVKEVKCLSPRTIHTALQRCDSKRTVVKNHDHAEHPEKQPLLPLKLCFFHLFYNNRLVSTCASVYNKELCTRCMRRRGYPFGIPTASASLWLF
jgi:hypothetical protein